MGFGGALSPVIYNTLIHSALGHTATHGHTIGDFTADSDWGSEEKQSKNRHNPLELVTLQKENFFWLTNPWRRTPGWRTLVVLPYGEHMSWFCGDVMMIFQVCVRRGPDTMLLVPGSHQIPSFFFQWLTVPVPSTLTTSPNPSLAASFCLSFGSSGPVLVISLRSTAASVASHSFWDKSGLNPQL